jgi:hypothetical protein
MPGRGTGHLEGITHVAAARRPDVAARRGVLGRRRRPRGGSCRPVGSRRGTIAAGGRFGCNSPTNTSTACLALTWTSSIRSPLSPPSPRARETWRPGTTALAEAAGPAGFGPTTPPTASSDLAWATPLYRSIFDPDARPRALRRRHQF